VPAVAEVQFKATNSQLVVTAFKTIGDSATAAGTKVQQFTAGATTKVQQFTSSLNAIKSQGDPFANLTNNMNKFNTTATTVGQKLKNFGSQFSNSIATIGTLGGTILNLSRQYQDLSDSQIRVDRSQLKVSKTTEAAGVAQGKLNALTAKGVTSGAEYNAALLNVKQALEAQDIAERNLQEAQEDHQRAQENFWIGLVPTVTSAGASVISVVKDIGGAGGLSGLIPKFKGVGEAAKGLGITMKGALIGTGIGAAIVALGIALEAFANNWWGVRDAVNDMGVALGNAIPALQPVLTALGKVGEGIVSTFGAGGTVPKAMAESSLAIALFGDTTTASLDKALKYTDFQKRLAEEQRKFDDIMMASRNTEERNAAIASMEKLIAEGEKLIASETDAQSLARNGIQIYPAVAAAKEKDAGATNSLSTATTGLTQSTTTLAPAITTTKTSLSDLGVSVGATAGTFSAVGVSIGPAVSGFQNLTAGGQALKVSVNAVNPELQYMTGWLSDVVGAASGSAKMMKELSGAIANTTKMMQKGTGVAIKYGSSLNPNYRVGGGGVTYSPKVFKQLKGSGGPKYVTFRGGKKIGEGVGTAPPITKVHQHGYQGTVHRPTTFIAGEGGRPEDVTVRPRGSVQRGGSAGGGGSTHITVSFEPQEFAQFIRYRINDNQGVVK
jgi:hypothetical protein